MAKILKKEILAPNIKKFIVEVPEVAKKAQPGQFIIIRIDEKGERIPLTIADFDREKGTVTIVFQEVGKTTFQLGLLNEGDEILDFVGPLGRPSEIEKFGTVCCIGGGVGTPEIYPVARALKAVGNYVISIVGARSKELVIMEKEMKEVSDELYITTDDGTYGMKGLVTDALKKILDSGKKIDRVIAVGPVIMMKAVSELTKNYNIKTIVSLNPMMLDGTGMCGICRVEIGGKTKFACVDGPEFDGHLVNYDLLMARLRTYLEEERISLQLFKEKMGI